MDIDEIETENAVKILKRRGYTVTPPSSCPRCGRSEHVGVCLPLPPGPCAWCGEPKNHVVHNLNGYRKDAHEYLDPSTVPARPKTDPDGWRIVGWGVPTLKNCDGWITEVGGTNPTSWEIWAGMGCSPNLTEPRWLLRRDKPAEKPVTDHEEWKYDLPEAHVPGLGTVRTCIDCHCLVAGGPTRCTRCVRDIEAAERLLAKPSSPNVSEQEGR